MTDVGFKAKEYANKGETTLPSNTTFFIIHVDDITKSKIAKLEQWKQYKDPNEVGVDRLSKNRIIREINDDEENSSSNTNNNESKTTGPSVYKLTLKDQFENYCFAYEYNDQLPFLRTGSTAPIPIKLGGRLIVNKDTKVSNGVILLDRKSCRYLGVDPSSELAKALNSNLVEKSINILQNPNL